MIDEDLESRLSNGVFDIPDEGPQTEAGLLFIEGAETVEQGARLFVVDDGDHGGGKGGPGVGAVVGFPLEGSASLDGAECREASAGEMAQNLDDGLVVGLVVGYEY